MQQRKVGRSGLIVSELGLGTMTWGVHTDSDDAAAQLIAFREAGGTLVDTAVTYGLGRSEQILGQLLADVIPRDEIVLASKAGIVRTEHERHINTGRGELLNRLEQSLRQLRVDHLDLWYVHIADDTVPFEETLSALDAAVTSGKVRYVGVSNYDGWHTARAATWQLAGHAGGRAPIVANQSRYNLLDRGLEREVFPACAAFGIGVMPYSPLGGGVLTGKYRTGIPADSRRAVAARTIAEISDREVGIVEAVATAAQGLASTPIAVSLAWVRDRPGVVAPIVGARTLGQLTSALAAQTLVLPAEITAALDDVSRPQRSYPEDLS